jgi:hypothetical protein
VEAQEKEVGDGCTLILSLDYHYYNISYIALSYLPGRSTGIHSELSRPRPPRVTPDGTDQC